MARARTPERRQDEEKRRQMSTDEHWVRSQEEAKRQAFAALDRMSPARRAYLEALNHEYCRRTDGGAPLVLVDVLFHVAQMTDLGWDEEGFAEATGLPLAY